MILLNWITMSNKGNSILQSKYQISVVIFEVQFPEMQLKCNFLSGNRLKSTLTQDSKPERCRNVLFFVFLYLTGMKLLFYILQGSP